MVPDDIGTPLQKGFCLRLPHPLEIQIRCNTFLEYFGLTESSPPGDTNLFHRGSMDIFWNLKKMLIDNDCMHAFIETKNHSQF